MIELHNVMDIRTGNIYSVVRVKASKAKWFIQVCADEVSR